MRPFVNRFLTYIRLEYAFARDCPCERLYVNFCKTCPGSIYQYRLTADYVVSARRPHRHNLNHTHHSFSFCDYNILYFWGKVNQSLTYFRLEVSPCGERSPHILSHVDKFHTLTDKVIILPELFLCGSHGITIVDSMRAVIAKSERRVARIGTDEHSRHRHGRNPLVFILELYYIVSG
nr:MAG TPA: hypothetical protein [Caudoviricetes sp.]